MSNPKMLAMTPRMYEYLKMHRPDLWEKIVELENEAELIIKLSELTEEEKEIKSQEIMKRYFSVLEEVREWNEPRTRPMS